MLEPSPLANSLMSTLRHNRASVRPGRRAFREHVLHGGSFPVRGLRAAKRGIRRLVFLTVSVARGGDQAPFSHFFMKLVFAAPESGLPSWLTALVEQVSAMHFFTNEVLAAPASGLPSLPTALLSQVSCARAAPPANATTNAANIIFLNTVSLPSMVITSEFDPSRFFQARGQKTKSERQDGSRA